MSAVIDIGHMYFFLPLMAILKQTKDSLDFIYEYINIKTKVHGLVDNEFMNI